MKVLERVVEKRVRDSINLDDMQLGFRPGRGTTDAIFIARQVQEKYLTKRKRTVNSICRSRKSLRSRTKRCSLVGFKKGWCSRVASKCD